MRSDHWQRIEELYHAAREDRAVLDKADPELRQEVESLLAQEKGAGFLESPALEVAAQQFVNERPSHTRSSYSSHVFFPLQRGKFDVKGKMISETFGQVRRCDS